MVPLLDATVQGIEPYFPPVIQAADHYIDVAQDTAGKQVYVLKERKVALEGKLSGLHAAASARLNHVFEGIHSTVLVLIDHSDALVDRVLPPNEDEKASRQNDAKKSTVALIPRALGVPLQLPARAARIVFVQAIGLSQTVVVRSSEQKARLFNFLSQGSQLISDKVVSATAPGRAIISSGKGNVSRKWQIAWESLVNAEEVVVVWANDRLYIVASKLRLPEIKDWTCTKVGDLKQTTSSATERITKGAYDATIRVAGGERASLVFNQLGLQHVTVQ